MSVNLLFDYEQEFIDKLRNANISFSNSYIAVLMYFREFTRPTNEMPMILTRFSPLLVENQTKDSFEWLLDNNLIYVSNLGETKIYRIADDYPDVLERVTGISGLSASISEKKRLRKLSCNSTTKVYLSPKGGVSEEGNYQSLLTRLKAAQHTIKAPIFSTRVYEETAKVFEEQAKRGVKIQVLVSSPSLLEKYRGTTVSDSPYLQWKKRLKNIKNITVREFTDESAVELSAGFLVDDSILRMVVFDYTTMPPLDGYLLELCNQSDQKINLINWYKKKFDESWEKAKYTRVPKLLRAVVSPFFFNLVLSIILILCCIKLEIQGVFYDIILIILGASLAYIGKKSVVFIRDFFSRLLKAMKSI